MWGLVPSCYLPPRVSLPYPTTTSLSCCGTVFCFLCVLRVLVANTGGLTVVSATRPWTAGVNTPVCAALVVPGGGRHNRVRDWYCATYSACTGLPATTEQHVPQWDVVDSRGEVEQARLDVATSDARTGLPLYLDVVVKCAYSVDGATLRARARRDGRAAADAAAEKRRRYRDAGNSLVPLAFEAGGRPSDSTAQFMRQLGAAWAETHASEDGEKPAPVTGVLWQQVSSLLQLGNAELILSANGR